MESSYYNKALEKAKIHNKCMNNSKLKNDIFSILNIVLVSFAGISNNIVGSEYNIVISIFLYCSLLVTGVHTYFNYPEEIEKHRVSSILYSTLKQNIEDDIIPTQYIRSQFQLLKAMEPDVPESYDDPLPPTPSQQTTDDNRNAAIEYEMSRFRNI